MRKLKLEDLKRREYKDKECIHFEVDLPSDEGILRDDLLVFRKATKDIWIVSLYLHLSSSGMQTTITRLIEHVSKDTDILFIASIGIHQMRSELNEMTAYLSKKVMKLHELTKDA